MKQYYIREHRYWKKKHIYIYIPRRCNHVTANLTRLNFDGNTFPKPAQRKAKLNNGHRNRSKREPNESHNRSKMRKEGGQRALKKHVAKKVGCGSRFPEICHLIPILLFFIKRSAFIFGKYLWVVLNVDVPGSLLSIILKNMRCCS